MPFAVESRDGVLVLTLDTPGSPINIFNHATAHQLIEILAQVTPATTRAIVFESAKTNSFINGVGLLLAHASRNEEDVARASTPPWTAYRMVREAPVPTIAVVEGNCFGCGVEFALQCDYRLAADTWETQFYMTELNDYLFLPLFGSTWNLPQAVGFADAIDLLLWGERWDGATAFARGLVDELAPHEALAEHRDGLVERVLLGKQDSRRRGPVSWGAREERAAERARRRIESLPPPYRPLYADALALLEGGARQVDGYLEHQRKELASSAASALSPMGKAAYGFFYLRQVASERAAGRWRRDGAPAVFADGIAGGDPRRAFVDDLRARRLRGVSFGGAADFRLVAAGQSEPANGDGRAASGAGIGVAIRTAIDGGSLSPVELFAPMYGAGGRLIELAAGDGEGAEVPAAPLRKLARTLQRYGFEVARTAPSGTFVTTRLLVAYLVPLVRALEHGVDVATINRTLRDQGFVRLPGEVLARLDGSAVAALAATLGGGEADWAPRLAALAAGDVGDRADAGLVDALAVSLLGAVLEARARREIRDTSIADLIARELLDFPRHLCSLGVWLKAGRVARALADPRLPSLVTPAALEAASAFVAAGRELYR